MPKTSAFVRGIAALEKRLNVREELRRLRVDPMRPLLREINKAGTQEFTFFQDDITTYSRAYNFYYLSLARFFPEMSVFLRWANGPYFVRKYRGKYTESQAKVVRRFSEISPFLEVDYVNCLIHARLLMDRVVRLSRWFLSGPELPSDSSFTDHRKFFRQLREPYGDHEAYAERIRSSTGWYEGLVEVRDKFIVHPGRTTFGMTPGIPPEGTELTIVWHRSGLDADGKPFRDAIYISVPRLAREIADFLRWFCEYALKARADSSMTAWTTRVIGRAQE